MAEIHNCGFALLPHPAYSPDLTPPDSSFPESEETLRRNEEVQVAVNEYFENLKDSFLKTGIVAEETR